MDHYENNFINATELPHTPLGENELTCETLLASKCCWSEWLCESEVSKILNLRLQNSASLFRGSTTTSFRPTV